MKKNIKKILFFYNRICFLKFAVTLRHNLNQSLYELIIEKQAIREVFVCIFFFVYIDTNTENNPIMSYIFYIGVNV